MSAASSTWPFADRESALRFSAFRNAIVRNDNSNRQLNICSPPGAPGLSLSRWLGDFTTEWGPFLARLILDEVDGDIAQGFEAIRLPGDRGKLKIVSPALLEVEDMAQYAALIDPSADDPRSWLVTVSQGAALEVRPELRHLDSQVQLLAPVLTHLPG